MENVGGHDIIEVWGRLKKYTWEETSDEIILSSLFSALPFSSFFTFPFFLFLSSFFAAPLEYIRYTLYFSVPSASFTFGNLFRLSSFADKPANAMRLQMLP